MEHLNTESIGFIKAINHKEDLSSVKKGRDRADSKRSNDPLMWWLLALLLSAPSSPILNCYISRDNK